MPPSEIEDWETASQKGELIVFDWNLDNTSSYFVVTTFEYDAAFTYADMRPGNADKEKRELIRRYAALSFPNEVPQAKWWAFRIVVQKGGTRAFDIENVPKLIIDSFCKKQIAKDRSPYHKVGLYAEDTLDFVRIMQVGGSRIAKGESEKTMVTIYGFVG